MLALIFLILTVFGNFPDGLTFLHLTYKKIVFSIKVKPKNVRII